MILRIAAEAQRDDVTSPDWHSLSLAWPVFKLSSPASVPCIAVPPKKRSRAKINLRKD